MCRRYGHGEAAYVRACYRTGKAGVHVPLAIAEWDGPGHHLPRLAASARSRATEPLCPRCKLPMSDCRDRCIPKSPQAREERLNFAAEFAGAVERGEKTQTIRPYRRRPIKPGDRLVLFTGQRTKKCRKLMETECRFTNNVEITEAAIVVGGWRYRPDLASRFARDDGFRSIEELRAWFRDHYGLPFRGQLIQWRKAKEKS